MHSVRHSLPTMSVFEYLLVISRYETEINILDIQRTDALNRIIVLENQVAKSIPIHFRATDIGFCFKSGLLTNEFTSRLFHFGDNSRPISLIVKTTFQVTKYAVFNPAKKVCIAIKDSVYKPTKDAPLAESKDTIAEPDKNDPKKAPVLAIHGTVSKLVPHSWYPPRRNMSTSCIVQKDAAPSPVIPVLPPPFL
jgi:hypothetical protein